MQLTLTVLGFLLVVVGVFVLVRYSKAPGGTIKFVGLEVSSGGAGLPLIALGIGCVLVAANVKTPGKPGDAGSTSAAREQTSAAAPAGDGTGRAAPAGAQRSQAAPGGAQAPQASPVGAPGQLPAPGEARPPVVPADSAMAPATSATALRVRAIIARHMSVPETAIDLHRDLHHQLVHFDQLDVTESILQIEEDCKVTFPGGVENETPITIDRLTQVLQSLHSGC
jgi:hypothetical protein